MNAFLLVRSNFLLYCVLTITSICQFPFSLWDFFFSLHFFLCKFENHKKINWIGNRWGMSSKKMWVDNKLEILTRWLVGSKKWKFISTNLDERLLYVQQFNAERNFNNSLSIETDCEKLIKKLSFIDRKNLSLLALDFYYFPIHFFFIFLCLHSFLCFIFSGSWNLNFWCVLWVVRWCLDCLNILITIASSVKVLAVSAVCMTWYGSLSLTFIEECSGQ